MGLSLSTTKPEGLLTKHGAPFHAINFNPFPIRILSLVPSKASKMSLSLFPVHPGLEETDYAVIAGVALAFTALDFGLGRVLGDGPRGEAIASQIFAIIASFGGAYGYLTFPDDKVDPLLGRYEYAHRMFLIAVGWFIYDTANCVGVFGRKYSYACRLFTFRAQVARLALLSRCYPPSPLSLSHHPFSLQLTRKCHAYSFTGQTSCTASSVLACSS